MLVLLASCGGSGTHSGGETNFDSLEISLNPSIVYQRAADWEQMSLHGIRLGDDAFIIPSQKIRQRTDEGWIIHRNLCRYRDTEGKITGLGVWDPNLIRRMNLATRASIEEWFGKPDDVQEINRFIIYQFQGGHIRVIWNTFDKRVTAVNILS